jgi:CrcB protein
MVNLLLVAVGGAFGSALRFGIGNLVNFPFGTMTVNILGAVFAGSIYAVFVDHINHRAFMLLMPGFLGGFTTFSAFSLDVLKLWEQQNFNILFLYLISTLIFSLLGVWLSYKITLWYFS